jgi:hypothetical protein
MIISQEWKTTVHALNLSQPDASTCQSACIAMAVGDKDVLGVRRKLNRLPGAAGDTTNMGKVIRGYIGDRYIYNNTASLNDIVGYLKAGEFLITHGYFTGSGHVIALDGVKLKADATYAFNVKDPWSEFDGPSWTYNNPKSTFYDGFYSDKTIYAACMPSVSVWDAAQWYDRRPDYNLKRAWVHRILPAVPQR